MIHWPRAPGRSGRGPGPQAPSPMFTAKHAIVLVILLAIVAIAAWPKLRFVDEDDFAPQRWRADEHPAFRPAGHD